VAGLGLQLGVIIQVYGNQHGGIVLGGGESQCLPIEPPTPTRNAAQGSLCVDVDGKMLQVLNGDACVVER
jgi:hypothetical protein